MIPDLIAQTLGLRPAAGPPVLEFLENWFENRQVLLLLARSLSTSRHRLGSGFTVRGCVYVCPSTVKSDPW